MNTKKKHWTQTPAGRKKMSEIQKHSWSNGRKNGPKAKAKVAAQPKKKRSASHEQLVRWAVVGARAELAQLEQRRVVIGVFLKGVR